MWTLAELARALPGAQLQGDGAVAFASVSTDTRSIKAGALFIALKGERFDAHDFAVQAVAAGAVALAVERALDVAVPQLIVSDSKRALGVGAAAWRNRFTLPLIAVTGSNGKTTVTQMLARILAQAYGENRRLATRGNLNNDIGAPLMLWELSSQHKVAVLELGMNHRGEIDYLAHLARPTVALVNNAQREHQEFLASVEATAEENGAAIAALAPDGVAVFPADDPCARIWRQLAGTRRVLDFARRGDAAVTAQYEMHADSSDLEIATPAGEIRLTLPVSGEHNVHNALAATAAALAIGVSKRDIVAGLSSFSPVAGRGVRTVLPGGALLIDDSYNANPDSVRAAIDVLAQRAAPRVLVLGDMGEVGDQGPQFHREVGAYAAERGIEHVLLLGEQTQHSAAAFGSRARHFAAIEPLIDAVRALAVNGATVLVKGSRFMKMERVAAALKNAPATEGTH